MTELTIFTSQIFVVMLLGLQSLNVNNGHANAAMLTSLGIGACSLMLYKFVPDASLTECAAYLLAGPIGIRIAMWLHPRMVNRKKRKPVPAVLAFMRAQFGHRIKGNINCGADRP